MTQAGIRRGLLTSLSAIGRLMRGSVNSYKGSMDTKLKEVRAWAQSKLDARTEPPWAVEQYQNLISTLDEILAARAVTISPEEDSRRSALRRERGLPQGANIRRIDTARRRPAVLRVRMPM